MAKISFTHVNMMKVSFICNIDVSIDFTCNRFLKDWANSSLGLLLETTAISISVVLVEKVKGYEKR